MSASHTVCPNKGGVSSQLFSTAARAYSFSSVIMFMDLFATLPPSFHLKLVFDIVLSAFYHVLRDYIYSITDFTLEQN